MISSIELADDIQKLIFYYVPKEKLIQSIMIRNKFYQYIQYRIDIYNDYIEEFNQWLRKGMNVSFLTKDGKLNEVFTTLHDFSKSLFVESRNEKKQHILNKIHEMRIQVEESYSLELSEEEKDELQSILSDLERIIQNQSSSP